MGPFRRYLLVPVGFAWLGVIVVLAIPVVLLMTVLYYIVQVARAFLPDGRRAGQAGA
jgi:hypothetical protein